MKNSQETPSLARRLGSLLYDALTLAALWLLTAALYTTLFGVADTSLARAALRTLGFLAGSAYFLWCWVRGGQTLAMKTWHMRVVDARGLPLSPALALKRYGLACAGYALGGLTLCWAWWDVERQFLHDRLAGTRMVKI